MCDISAVSAHLPDDCLLWFNLLLFELTEFASVSPDGTLLAPRALNEYCHCLDSFLFPPDSWYVPSPEHVSQVQRNLVRSHIPKKGMILLMDFDVDTDILCTPTTYWKYVVV
jgi:hypothetical protein